MIEKDIIEFAKIVGKLKRIPRTGWKIRGVKEPESIAEHLFGVAFLGMVLSDLKGLNTEKIMKMLIMHDVEESATGDIDALVKKRMNRKELKRKQVEAVEKIFLKLPKKLKDEYVSLWKEMDDGLTEEAKFCKDVDKLEMMVQALSYENEDETNKRKLVAFWTREEINAPQRVKYLKKIYKELRKERGLK